MMFTIGFSFIADNEIRFSVIDSAVRHTTDLNMYITELLGNNSPVIKMNEISETKFVN